MWERVWVRVRVRCEGVRMRGEGGRVRVKKRG